MNFLKNLRFANIQRNAEWDPDHKITHLFRAVELGGEVGELLNLVKKSERIALGFGGSMTTLDELREELADVLICLDLLAMEFGVDLEKVTMAKFNETTRVRGLHTKLLEWPDVVKEREIMYNLATVISQELVESAIFDEEEMVLDWAWHSARELMANMAHTGVTIIRLRQNIEARSGAIWLYHGNGEDLISDYSDIPYITEIVEMVQGMR